MLVEIGYCNYCLDTFTKNSNNKVLEGSQDQACLRSGGDTCDLVPFSTKIKSKNIVYPKAWHKINQTQQLFSSGTLKS